MTTIHQIPCPIPFPLKTVNCYYIEDSRPTLIDTGVRMGGCMAWIRESIRETGGLLRDLKRIIITHGHADHLGLAGTLAEETGAEIFIHCLEFPKCFSNNPRHTDEYFDQFSKFLQCCDVPGQQVQEMAGGLCERLRQWVAPIVGPQFISEGDRIIFDDFELQVLHTPGHTFGGVSLYNQEDEILFSGDTLLEKITANPVTEIGRDQGRNEFLSIPSFSDSLKRIAGLAIKQVLPGHGHPFSNAAKRAAFIIDHFEERRDLVVGLIKEETANGSRNSGVTLATLASRMFSGLEDMELFLGLSEAYAYTRLLESESLVETWEEKGVRRFRLTR